MFSDAIDTDIASSHVTIWTKGVHVSEYFELSFHAATKMAALDNFRTVLITDKIDPICKEVLQKNGVDVVMKPGLAKEDIVKEIDVSVLLPSA